MEWVKLYTSWHNHPKTLDLSLSAKGMWVDALAYAGAHETNGHIPLGIVRRIAGDEEGRVLADALVNAGLWEVAEGGWLMHAFTERQCLDGLELRRAHERARQHRFREAQRDLSREVKRDVSRDVTPSDKSREEESPPLPPRKRGGRVAKAPQEKPHRYTDEGDTLAREVWETLSPKPIGGFVGFRERVSEALSAGHTAASLRIAAPTVGVWSRAGIELALTKSNGNGHAPAAERQPYRDPSIDALVAGMRG